MTTATDLSPSDRARGALASFLALGLLFACQSQDGPSLPPSAGVGAPPPPSIPALARAEDEKVVTSDGKGRASTGTLFPRHEASLGPKASGVISQITVEEGARVKKGQLLFRLDAAQAVLGVEQAKAAVATAQVTLDSAKLDYERAKSLFDKGAIAPAAHDQAKARYDSATAGLHQAKVAQGMTQRLSADTAVYSPIDGVVAEKRMNVGEMATMMPPSVVLVIQDVDSLELRARLPETALRTVREGSKILARFPAVELERHVTIRRVKPTVDARTRTIEVIADVDNGEGRLKAGMLAEVSYGAKEAAAPADVLPASEQKPGEQNGAKAP